MSRTDGMDNRAPLLEACPPPCDTPGQSGARNERSAAPDSDMRRVTRTLASLLLVAWVGMSAGCDRNDMHDGARVEAYEPSQFFADGRSSRPIVDGTVPRGVPALEIPYPADPAGGTPADSTAPDRAGGLPEPVTMDFLERGRQRYDIYCAVCHGATGGETDPASPLFGRGNGMIVQRGFTPPPSLVLVPGLAQRDRALHERTAALQTAPLSHFVGVIANGYGAMYSYNDRVPPRDRWAIAAYIRVLQLSHDAQKHGVTQPPTTAPATAPTGVHAVLIPSPGTPGEG